MRGDETDEHVARMLRLGRKSEEGELLEDGDRWRDNIKIDRKQVWENVECD